MMKTQPTPTEQEEFLLLMSLALDGLLDETEQAKFDTYLDLYPSLTTQWNDWQSLHHQLAAMPHAAPAPNFVGRFELQLAQQERRRQLWQGLWIGTVTLLLWLIATAGVVSIGAYLFVNQSTLIANMVQNMIYLWTSLVTWLDMIINALNTFAATPQGIGLAIGYIVFSIALFGGWLSLLRRSTQLVDGAVVDQPSSLSMA